MTTSTQQRNLLRSSHQMLDDFRAAWGAGGLFVRAMEKFLTAADYPDDTLMRAALAEAIAALEGDITEAVEKLVERSSASQAMIREVTDELEGTPIEPDEQFDELGRSLSLGISTALRALCDFRDVEIAVTRKHGIEVPNAAKLDEHIAYWQGMKANLVDCWPWTTSTELPPVDRGLVAQSRAAFQAGEQAEDIDTLIERLRSE